MELLVLGSGTLVPRAGQGSSCYALRHPGGLHVLDLGRGAVQRMADAGLDPLAVDHVHLSHLHPDHCGDLVHLLFSSNYGGRAESGRPLCLSGPVGLGELLERLAGAWRWLEPAFPVELVECEGGERFGVAGLGAAAHRLPHGSTPDIGLRLEGAGASFAYTGDCEPGPGLVELARGVDLLVAECAGPDAPRMPGHMAPTPLGEAAAAAGVGQLVVGHLYPGTGPDHVRERIAANFAGRLTLARDGLQIAFGGSNAPRR